MPAAAVLAIGTKRNVLPCGIEKDVAFLEKPFAPIALAKKVREVLDETKVSGP